MERNLTIKGSRDVKRSGKIWEIQPRSFYLQLTILIETQTKILGKMWKIIKRWLVGSFYLIIQLSFSAVCALVGCILMGPRIGKFDKNGMPCHMPGHSVPLSALGGLILVFGFFACNGTKQVQFKFSKKTTFFLQNLPLNLT